MSRITRLTDIGADPRQHRVTRRHLGLIAVAGLLWRWAFVLLARRDSPPTGDGTWFHLQADHLADGRWMINPIIWDFYGESVSSSAKPPIYTLYLSAWSKLGLDTPLGHRLVSSLIAVGVIYLIGLVAWRLAGPRAAVIAAVIAAANPNLWILDVGLRAETLFALFIAAVLWAAYRFWEDPSVGNVALLGALIGLAGLTRYEGSTLVFWLLFPLVAMMAGVRWRDRVMLALAGVASLLLVLSPWIAYNYTTFESPTLLGPAPAPITTSANCDSTYYGDLIGYHDLACQPETTILLASGEPACGCDPDDWECLKDRCKLGDESVYNKFWHEEGLKYIDANRSRIPVVVLARVGRIWQIYRPAQGVQLDTTFEGRGTTTAWLGVATFFVLLVLSVLGLGDLRRRRITMLPLLSMAVLASFTAATTMGITRYRIALDVALVVAAAVAIEALWRRGISFRRPGGDRSGEESSIAR